MTKPTRKVEQWQIDDAARLKTLFAERATCSQAEFGARYGIGNQGYVWQLLNGRRPLNIAVAKAFSVGLDVAIEEFSPTIAAQIASANERVRSEGVATSSEQKSLVDHNVEPGPDMAPRPVPLISWVQAGDWCEVINNFAPGDAEEWLFITGHSRPRAFALRIRGISMEPKYHEGEIIFVDPDLRAENGSHVVVRLDNENEATFKKLVIEGDRRFLQPLNPAWPDKMIEINGNATICGVVFAMYRSV